MPAPFFPNSACVVQADDMQTKLVDSVMSLFKSGFSPTTQTVKADLEANEADFTTYTTKTIEAWGDPILSDLGGAQITAPTVQWTLAATPAAPNTIGGYWLETAAGVVILIRQFDNPVPMVAANQGLTIVPTIVFPNGQ